MDALAGYSDSSDDEKDQASNPRSGDNDCEIPPTKRRKLYSTGTSSTTVEASSNQTKSNEVFIPSASEIFNSDTKLTVSPSGLQIPPRKELSGSLGAKSKRINIGFVPPQLTRPNISVEDHKAWNRDPDVGKVP